MRPGRGDVISAGSALALLVSMFALTWYEFDRIPGTPAAVRHGVVRTENAWQALTGLRWLMLATIVVALVSLGLRAGQYTHGNRTRTGMAVAVLGAVTAALLVVRVFIDLPSSPAISDQKLGAALGVVLALGIALGGWDTLRGDRALASARRQRARKEHARGSRIPLG